MSLETSLMAFYGGYDYTFCDPLPDECPCQVCTLVQKDPYQLTCCGKIFCKGCLEQLSLIKQSTTCPNCRGDFIKDKQYFRDVNTGRKIKHLRIRCENEKQGCTWTGYLKDMKESHIPKCSYELVQCTNMKYTESVDMFFENAIFYEDYDCGKLVQRRNLEKHMTAECEWRLVSCVYCKCEGSVHYIDGKHNNECHIACTNNGCQEKIKQSLLKTHQESCPHKIVSCRYSSIWLYEKIKEERYRNP